MIPWIDEDYNPDTAHQLVPSKDMAAGRLLVAEAGGKYSGMHGEPQQLRGPDLLVDNGLLHEEILALFADIFRGEYRVPIAQR